MKVLVAGNENYGLASALATCFPEAQFCSRETGYDFSKSEDIERFSQASLEFSFIVLSASLFHFQQIQLLQAVSQCWIRKSHHGHVVAIGSTIDRAVKGNSQLYAIEKKSLKAYCQNLHSLSLGSTDKPGPGFKVTYLSLGHLNTDNTMAKHPQARLLDMNYVASLVRWVFEQPRAVSIGELSLDPMQY